MNRPTLALALILAAPALADDPASLAAGPTCEAFLAMDGPARLAVLATIQPLGDEIDAEDQDQADQWSNAVARACEADPGAALPDAAAVALGGD